MNGSYEFSNVDSFSCGAIGPKGERVFYLQIHDAGEVLTLKVEKQQVTALAEFLNETLVDVFGFKTPRPPGGEGWLDSVGGGELPPDSPDNDMSLSDYDEPFFSEPDEADWVVGRIGAAYQQNKDFIILWLEELTQEGEKQATARFPLKVDQASNFIRQARSVVASGRPPCPYCRAPLNDDDGFCPCWN